MTEISEDDLKRLELTPKRGYVALYRMHSKMYQAYARSLANCAGCAQRREQIARILSDLKDTLLGR